MEPNEPPQDPLDGLGVDVTDAELNAAVDMLDTGTFGASEIDPDAVDDTGYGSEMGSAMSVVPGESGEDDDDDDDEADDSRDHFSDEDEPRGSNGDNNNNAAASDDEDEGEQSEEERQAEMERARVVLLARGFRPRDGPRRAPLLQSFDLAGVAQYIAAKQCKDIVVMCGAGISVSAGIPDFRTPGTGLYDNLQKYDLPDPQAIFTLSYFREKPDAFYRLCAELWPDNFAPTPTHHFIAELHARGVLRRCFTQNIDSLEAMAHIPKDKIVAAHGNFDTCSCIETTETVDTQEVRKAIAHGKEGEEGWMAMAERHGGLVKPDIVFFGEQLPERFFELADSDLRQCDLLIILGTSLKVQPFASLVGHVREDVPRVLINREEVGTDEQPILKLLGFIDDRALDFSEETRYRDACFLGDCDAGVKELAVQMDEAFAAASGKATRGEGGGSAEEEGEAAAAGASSSGDTASWVAALNRRVETHPPAPGPPTPIRKAAAAAAEKAAAAESAAAANPTGFELESAAEPPVQRERSHHETVVEEVEETRAEKVTSD